MDELERIAADLGDLSRADSPREFPGDPDAAAQPGLYAWWADDDARRVMSGVVQGEIQPLIYLGQAGATKWPSGTRDKRTIAHRILGDELKNALAGATFRISLAAILREPLALRLTGPKQLDSGSGERLTVWMHEHLRVTIRPYPDRDTLEHVKQALLARLDPPLNLGGNVRPSAVRDHLSELRRVVYRGG